MPMPDAFILDGSNHADDSDHASQSMYVDLRGVAIRTPVVTPIKFGHLALDAVESCIGGAHAHSVEQNQSIRVISQCL